MHMPRANASPLQPDNCHRLSAEGVPQRAKAVELHMSLADYVAQAAGALFCVMQCQQEAISTQKLRKPSTRLCLRSEQTAPTVETRKTAQVCRTYRVVDGIDPVQPDEPARDPLHGNNQTLSYRILGPPSQSVLRQQA